MKLLTDSRMRTARACQRLHRFKYELGYRPAEDPETLAFGLLCHRGLEGLWRAWMTGGEYPLRAGMEAMGTAANPFELAKAQAMLAAYEARWSEEPFEVLAVEAEFRAPLVNPATGRASQNWELGGKIDAIIRDPRDGRVLIVEHKTASGEIGPGSDYWKKLRLDGQVSTYFAGAQALGHEPAACLYDVLGKPALRPYQPGAKRTEAETPEQYQARIVEALAEDPARYFQRGEVSRFESELEEAAFDRWQLAQQIRESELAGRAPRNPDACTRYGRTCEFFPVCSGEASLDDATRYRRSANVHPELTEATDAQQG